MPFTHRFLTLFLSLAFAAESSHAHHHCADGNAKQKRNTAKMTYATVEETYYDVTHVKLDLQMTNQSTALSGNAITTGRVVVPAMGIYAFELDGSLAIDSFKFNGQALPVQSTGAIRKVTLPVALSTNSTFTAQTFYHGTPPAGTGFFTRGVNHFSLPSGTKGTYTLSDMYTAQDWWPSKQVILDKVDSVDVWITVPGGLKAGSNGKLQNVTTLANGDQRFEWKHRFPLKYYLISVAVAPYTEWAYYMHFDNSTDSMLVQNFAYDTTGIYPADRRALDSVGYGINLFSRLFGRYPFWKEKYGNCLTPLGGGMEHQTMTTLGYNTGASVTMHELGHQWWGDHVSQKSWQDIWLSEGFATYCEQLYAEYTYGTAAARTVRNSVFSGAMFSNTPSVYVDDTTNANRVFNYQSTYQKGAAVVHMLRYLAPHDSLFFKACRAYQQQYAFKHANTEELKAVFAGTYGMNLDSFFTQWVYKRGHPLYAITWNQRNGTAYVRITQSSSQPASNALFSTPVDIQLASAQGDTTIKVYNNQYDQLYSWPISKTITTVRLDPDNHILDQSAALTRKDTTLAVKTIPRNNWKAYPNPTRTAWTVENIPNGTHLQLTDNAGRLLWNSTADGKTVSIPAEKLAAGTYWLRGKEKTGTEIAGLSLIRH